MSTETFDAIVVGAGQAGPAIAARCSQRRPAHGRDRARRFGGTCVNVGCVPTKTLVASARAIHLARRGAEFGFEIGDLRVDMARVKARKDAIVRAVARGRRELDARAEHAEVIVGDARFVGAGHAARSAGGG